MSVIAAHLRNMLIIWSRVVSGMEPDCPRSRNYSLRVLSCTHTHALILSTQWLSKVLWKHACDHSVVELGTSGFRLAQHVSGGWSLKGTHVYHQDAQHYQMFCVTYQGSAEEHFFWSHYEYFIRTRVICSALVFFSLGCCGNMSTRCTFPLLGSHWCQMLTVAPTMLQLWYMLTDKTPGKVGEFKPFQFPRNALFFSILHKGQQGGGGLNEKRVASRHKATSYLDSPPPPDIPEKQRRFYRHV